MVPNINTFFLGIAQSVALVVAPFFGIGSHFSKEWSLIIAGCIGVAGCIPFAFSINPTANTSLAFVVLLAMGEYGNIHLIIIKKSPRTSIQWFNRSRKDN